jgi:hypothetical protein
MPRYNEAFEPPAPVVDVSITSTVDPSKVSQASGKLDTGADLSVIPQDMVAELQLIPSRWIMARSYEGVWTQRPTYLVNVTAANFYIPHVEVVSAVRRDILLGRNVLNHFTITLKGKDLIFEIVDP